MSYRTNVRYLIYCSGDPSHKVRDDKNCFFANLSFRQSVATRDLENDTEISQSLRFFDMTGYLGATAML